MASLERRVTSSGETRWRAKVRVNGYPTLTKTFRTKKDAQFWANELELKANSGQSLEAEISKTLMSDLILRYRNDCLDDKKSRIDYERHLDYWDDRIGQYYVTNVTPSLISSEKQKLLRTNTVFNKLRSPQTVNRYLATLSGVFTTAVKEWNLLNNNPVYQVKKFPSGKSRIRYLSQEELPRLLKVCEKDPKLLLAVHLSLATGGRKSEIMNLRWEQIDFENQIVFIHGADTKNSESKVLNIRGKAYELLSECYYNEPVKSGFIFLNPKTGKPKDFSKAFRNAMKEAEITNFRWHDLRHTFASYLAMSGASQPVLMKALGHKSPAMTKVYTHLANDYLGNMIEDMSNKFITPGNQR